MQVFIRTYLKKFLLHKPNIFEERGRTLLTSSGEPFEGHTLGSLLQHAEAAWSRVGSRPLSSGNVWTLDVFLRVMLPYQMRQDANTTRQERSLSCACQTFRVHRHFDLRVLSTTARVPHIGSGWNSLEFSLDHGRASEV